MNSTYHTTHQYHFCLGENLLRGDGAQSCLSVCHQSSLSSPLSSPLLYWLRHQCWQIIQSGDDAAFRQSVIFPNTCANKPSLSALSCSLQPDPSNQVMWLTSPTIYRHVCGRIIFRLSAVYTESNCCVLATCALISSSHWLNSTSQLPGQQLRQGRPPFIEQCATDTDWGLSFSFVN